MKEVLGEHIHTFYVENKRAEWDDYRHAGLAVGDRPVPVDHLATQPRIALAAEREEAPDRVSCPAPPASCGVMGVAVSGRAR